MHLFQKEAVRAEGGADGCELGGVVRAVATRAVAKAGATEAEQVGQLGGGGHGVTCRAAEDYIQHPACV